MTTRHAIEVHKTEGGNVVIREVGVAMTVQAGGCVVVEPADVPRLIELLTRAIDATDPDDFSTLRNMRPVGDAPET